MEIFDISVALDLIEGITASFGTGGLGSLGDLGDLFTGSLGS